MTFALQNINEKHTTRHVMGWALFILYEMGTIYFAVGVHTYVFLILFFYVLNIGLFYFNAHLVLPFAFKESKRPYVKAAVMIAAEILVYIIIKYSLDQLLALIFVLPNITHNFQKYVGINIWRGLFFIGISTLYWSILRMSNYERRTIEAEKQYYFSLAEQAKLEQALTETQNAYLQQQINPHFLFNALNLIYNSFYQFSSSAATCVSKLAEIMRYTFEEIDTDGKTELSSEIEQIQNLIDINRLRYKFPLHVQFELKGDISDQRILPLVLLSFVENMFKHGNLKTAEYPALLSLEVDQGKLIFITKNLKRSWSPSFRKQHLGLSNATKRLTNTYLENYQLSIHDEDDTFELELHLTL